MTQVAPFNTCINMPLHVDTKCTAGYNSLPALHSLAFLLIVHVNSKMAARMDWQTNNNRWVNCGRLDNTHTAPTTPNQSIMRAASHIWQMQTAVFLVRMVRATSYASDSNHSYQSQHCRWQASHTKLRPVSEIDHSKIGVNLSVNPISSVE